MNIIYGTNGPIISSTVGTNNPTPSLISLIDLTHEEKISKVMDHIYEIERLKAIYAPNGPLMGSSGDASGAIELLKLIPNLAFLATSPQFEDFEGKSFRCRTFTGSATDALTYINNSPNLFALYYAEGTMGRYFVRGEHTDYLKADLRAKKIGDILPN